MVRFVFFEGPFKGNHEGQLDHIKSCRFIFKKFPSKSLLIAENVSGPLSLSLHLKGGQKHRVLWKKTAVLMIIWKEDINSDSKNNIKQKELVEPVD